MVARTRVTIDTSSVKPHLRNKADVIKDASVRAVTRATFYVEAEVKESIAGRRAEHVSVDTGRFLNSVKSNVYQTEGEVYTNLEYAPFLEWGTSAIPERRHFRNSKNRSEKKIEGFFEAEVKKTSDI